MAKIDILSRLDQADEIYSLPQTLLEILQAVENDNWSAKSMAAIISKDTGLTARILRMANSSFYAQGRGDITTVNRAILVLGVSMVKCLALSTAIFNPPREIKNKLSFDIHTLYTHFLSTAIASRQLAEEVHYPKPEEAFTAGLLHDVGVLFILRISPEQYNKILENDECGESLIDKEQEAFGTDHAEVGYLIARRWQLPSVLQNAIGNHHRLIEYDNLSDYGSLDQIVALANLVNRHVFSMGGESVEASIKRICRLVSALDLEQEVINKINQQNLQETFKASQNMGLDIGDPLTLLEKANQQIMRSYLTIEALFRERQELSRQILQEEHRLGAIKSKNIAVATLSHYINNAATAISGRIQLIQMLLKNGEIVDNTNKLGPAMETIDTSLIKILAVLAELKSLTSLEEAPFHKDSSTINIDTKIQRRISQMKNCVVEKP